MYAYTRKHTQRRARTHVMYVYVCICVYIYVDGVAGGGCIEVRTGRETPRAPGTECQRERVCARDSARGASEREGGGEGEERERGRDVERSMRGFCHTKVRGPAPADPCEDDTCCMHACSLLGLTWRARAQNAQTNKQEKIIIYLIAIELFFEVVGLFVH